jgi:hypothetical protein
MCVYTCSVCKNQGHTKRSKFCPANQTTYKKPVILYDHINFIYFSIIKETDLTPYTIALCMKNNTARWCYSRGNNKYMVCNKDALRPNKNAVSIAIVIPKPTNAVLSILMWELIYLPPNSVRSLSCECPICYAKFKSNKLVKLDCHHSFCLPCIQGCISSVQPTEQIFVCPLCRQQPSTVTLSDPILYNTLASVLYKL